MSRLRIAETFASIQGEGMWLGVPSFFIRVSGCNLRCRWCDTPYASWHPEGPMNSLDDLLDEAAQSGLEHIVLTGGEPMLFEPVEELTYRLADRGHVITIETAGTVDRPVVCHLMSLSPKLAHSAPDPEVHPDWNRRHEETRADLAPCASLMKRHPFQLKFVVNPEGGMDDVGEIEGILARLPKVDPAKVFLMAEGTSSADLHRRERLLVDVCMSRGWRLIPRFHIDLFGDTRGT